MFLNFQKENEEFFSYFCKEISLSNNQQYFIKTHETIKNFLNYLNNDVIFQNMQISLSQVEKNFDLKLDQLQNLLRKFYQKYINRELFKHIRISIQDYVKKRLFLTTYIKQFTKNEIVLTLNFDIKIEEFLIALKLSKEDEEISKGFFFNSSHVIVDESTLIFSRNFSRFFNFSEIGKINFEKLICEKIKEFEKIHLNLLYEKLKSMTMKNIFFPYKLEINESYSKINFFYSKKSSKEKEKFLLFSLFNDVKGSLQIVDEDFLMRSDKLTKEQIKSYLTNLIQNESSDYFTFSEIIFENFFTSFFTLHGFHVKYEKFNPCNNLVTLKFLVHENKAANRKCFLSLGLNILRNNKFFYEKISLEVAENFPSEEKIINVIDLDNMDIFYKNLNTNMGKVEKLEYNLFKKITSLIKIIQIEYDEFLVNLTEILNYSSVYELKRDEENEKNFGKFSSISTFLEGNQQIPTIRIPVKDNIEKISLFIDRENSEILEFYIKDFVVHNKNLLIKINFHEQNLNSKFPYNLNNFSIFDTDNIIFYNSLEKALNIYFLTKMNVKNTVDFNYFRRFFTKILNKLLSFIKKMSNLISMEEMKKILNDSENVLISPIGLQFKYNFFEHSNKTILIHFVTYVNSEKKNLKCLILPLEYHHHSLFSFDLLLKMIHECDEMSILLSKLKYFIFLSAIYNKISTRLSTYIFPIGKNTNDLINRQNKIFVFLKDYKTFHIIVHNKLSVFLEIPSINSILIYSSYLWNSENCMRFIDSIIKSQEMAIKNSNGDKNYNFNIDGIKKLIVLSNDPVLLLQDVNNILNYIEKFE